MNHKETIYIWYMIAIIAAAYMGYASGINRAYDKAFDEPIRCTLDVNPIPLEMLK